jgi:hypothetical protein
MLQYSAKFNQDYNERNNGKQLALTEEEFKEIFWK